MTPDMTEVRPHPFRPTRRLLAALLFSALVACAVAGQATPALAGGGMCHANTATKTITTGTGLASEIRVSCYTPTVLYVEPGQTAVWTNRDSVAHTVTGVANSWGSTEQFTLGQSASFRFDVAGVFPYFCALHPLMQGVVVVGDGRPSALQPIAAISTLASAHASGGPTQVATTPPAPTSHWYAAGWAIMGMGIGTLATSFIVLLGRRGVTR